MFTINKLVAQGRGLAAALLKRAATVELDWDVRQKSRFDATDSTGRSLGVFLPRGTVLRGGDVLVAEDGSLVLARAAAQPVLVVRHCPDHGAVSDLARAAYHLGNRHVAVEVKPDHLKLEPDHVLAGMLRRMHLLVSEEKAPFEPEAGAYQAGHGAHGQWQGHAHDHHDHGHGTHATPVHEPAVRHDTPHHDHADPHHDHHDGHDHEHGHKQDHARGGHDDPAHGHHDGHHSHDHSHDHGHKHGR